MRLFFKKNEEILNVRLLLGLRRKICSSGFLNGFFGSQQLSHCSRTTLLFVLLLQPDIDLGTSNRVVLVLRS